MSILHQVLGAAGGVVLHAFFLEGSAKTRDGSKLVGISPVSLWGEERSKEEEQNKIKGNQKRHPKGNNYRMRGIKHLRGMEIESGCMHTRQKIHESG